MLWLPGRDFLSGCCAVWVPILTWVRAHATCWPPPWREPSLASSSNHSLAGRGGGAAGAREAQPAPVAEQAIVRRCRYRIWRSTALLRRGRSVRAQWHTRLVSPKPEDQQSRLPGPVCTHLPPLPFACRRYEAFKAIKDGPQWAQLTEAQQRIVDGELRDFVLGGVALEVRGQQRHGMTLSWDDVGMGWHWHGTAHACCDGEPVGSRARQPCLQGAAALFAGVSRPCLPGSGIACAGRGQGAVQRDPAGAEPAVHQVLQQRAGRNQGGRPYIRMS